MNDAGVNNQQVFKRFKINSAPSAAVETRDVMHPYRRQIEESTVARFIADKFNRRNAARAGGGLLEIKVASARVVETGTGGVYNMERLLTGQFTKWCNNDGTWNEEAFEGGVADKTLLEFMLYSYTVTGGYMLVTDLQGTKAEPSPPGPAWADPARPGYTLTDPCVLCTNRARFGDAEYGNLGPEFMARNLERCCRLLGVPVPIVEGD